MYPQLLYSCPVIIKVKHFFENVKVQRGKFVTLRKPHHLV